MNMDYCKFENTLGDLRQCERDLDEVPSSVSERQSRRAILELCAEIAERYSDELDETR